MKESLENLKLRRLVELNSKASLLKQELPREVVSLLGLKRGDKTEWKKILDDEGTVGKKGEILAIVRKLTKVVKT